MNDQILIEDFGDGPFIICPHCYLMIHYTPDIYKKLESLKCERCGQPYITNKEKGAG